MFSSALKPQNLPEKLIWYYIVCTYPIYYLGGQYLLAPLLGYFLVLCLWKQWWNQTLATPPEEQITISLAVWFWILGILMIEIALIVGHLDFNFSFGRIINSSVNRWLRSWSLFPIFLLVGSLKIRPQLIYRAVCIVCIQSLVLLIIGSILRMPSVFYTSPLALFGGGKYYDITVFGTVVDNVSQLRFLLFAPWAPALGLVANVYFVLVQQEKNSQLKWWGMIGAIAMIIGSASRLGAICLPLTLFSTWFLVNIYRPQVQLTTGLGAFLLGISASTVIEILQFAEEKFTSSRAGSSRVRNILGRIAIYRWQNEAVIWGHATVNPRGPQLVGYMPIGTHHTWFGILYTHGLVGCLSLAIPFFWSFIELVFKAQKIAIAKVGLSLILVLAIFTMGENIETLTYLYWPGLIILGIALQDNSRPKHLTI
jgi:hypothetical protein